MLLKVRLCRLLKGQLVTGSQLILVKHTLGPKVINRQKKLI